VDGNEGSAKFGGRQMTCDSTTFEEMQHLLGAFFVEYKIVWRGKFFSFQFNSNI
jgi:hypothetical protein